MEKEERRRLVKLLQGLMQHEMAEAYFNEPVDPVALELSNYFDIIKRPMDLGTILRKLQQHEYHSAASVLADVRQVWHNCYTFNEAGSQIFHDCRTLEAHFERAWSAAGLDKYAPLREARPSGRGGAVRDGEQPPGKPTAAKKPTAPPARDERWHYSKAGAAPSTARPGQGPPPVPQQQARAGKPQAPRAALPTGPGPPRGKPTLLTRAAAEGLVRGDGGMPAAFPQQHTKAGPGNQQQQRLPHGVSGSGLPSAHPMPGGHMQGGAAGGLGAMRVSHPLHKCLLVVEAVLGLEDAGPFAMPVDPLELGLTDYFDIVKRPMDLGTIRNRLAPGVAKGWGTIHYKSTADVLRDVQLVWYNCRLYNNPQDDICAMCDYCERYFNTEWEAAGLGAATTMQAQQLQQPPPSSSSHKRKAPHLPPGGGPPPQKPRGPQRAPGAPLPPGQKMQSLSGLMARPELSSGPFTSTSAMLPDAPSSLEGRNSSRCEVCRRAKKGRCGSKMAAKGCLARHGSSGAMPFAAAPPGAALAGSGSLLLSGSSVLQEPETQPHTRVAQPKKLPRQPPLPTWDGPSLREVEEALRAPMPEPPPPLALQPPVRPPSLSSEQARVQREALQAFTKAQARQKAFDAVAQQAADTAASLADARAACEAAAAAEESEREAEAAAKALEPWPPDALLVPDTFKPPRPRPPTMRSDVQQLAAFWFGPTFTRALPQMPQLCARPRETAADAVPTSSGCTAGGAPMAPREQELCSAVPSNTAHGKEQGCPGTAAAPLDALGVISEKEALGSSSTGKAGDNAAWPPASVQHEVCAGAAAMSEDNGTLTRRDGLPGPPRDACGSAIVTLSSGE